MRRSYELTVILRLDADDSLRSQIDEIKGFVEADELGEVTKIDTSHFGRRRLAYELDGQREGFYVIFYADIDAKAIEELERELKLSNYVLRHLLVKAED
jgi:small subunit ribosomal protein S6